MFLPPPGRDPLAHAVRQGEQAETDGVAAVPAGVLADAQALQTSAAFSAVRASFLVL